jgi:hypothetical protein
MFVDDVTDDDGDERRRQGAGQGQGQEEGGGLDIANAIPGHVVAYEDMEDDLLLAGDLKWK